MERDYHEEDENPKARLDWLKKILTTLTFMGE
jgi:hypothetical protein